MGLGPAVRVQDGTVPPTARSRVPSADAALPPPAIDDPIPVGDVEVPPAPPVET